MCSATMARFLRRLSEVRAVSDTGEIQGLRAAVVRGYDTRISKIKLRETEAKKPAPYLGASGGRSQWRNRLLPKWWPVLLWGKG